ncbi:MAG: iron ABC transporter substrate-binding protein [Mongoliibacter sp.]|uniref:ABC transporter substrate-binding protein n=1 Tax=Mongoliibacter sp. TaxID=2022438 RepID=UPI0012F20297|nr:ABC transporter substrate-binding protein [Mongoliibacter sp.]TVP51804.1 MAG: iron ABC transporter substrate-binding protein [Mongoliibacter sp.]
MLDKIPHYFTYFFLVFLIFCSCTEKISDHAQEYINIPLTYAQGFSLQQGDGYLLIEVNKAFPEQKKPFIYLVLESPESTVDNEAYDAVIQQNVSKIILTSTTQVPHLDYLGATELLIGFPNLNLISSQKTRKRIKEGLVEDLGSGAQANIEKIIDLEPDLVMISTLGEDLKNLEILKKAGIPTVLNGEYVEQHPLGRAEWIKFTGALLGKLDEANAVFEAIEKDYLEAEKMLRDQMAEKPTVLSGVMYKDIWYVPGADSWGARLLDTAGGDYLFADQKGSGSSQLSYEYVLDRAEDAAFWIGASDFNNLQEMKNADPRYAHFRAFQEGNVFTYTQKRGETGGLEYFELGYLRPDLILKDLIQILHPDVLSDYEPYFYTQLND